MWNNDEENGQFNWRNSEVTRSFVENSLEGLLKKEAECGCEDSKDKEESEEGNDEDEKELVVILEPVAVAQQEINEVIEKLAALAEASEEYGNEKVLYLIEKTMNEVQDIRDDLGA